MSQPADATSPPSFPDRKSTKPAPAKGRFGFSKVFGRWWWLATLLVIAVTYIVTQIPKWMDVRGPLYESTALIEVKPILDFDPTTTAPGIGGPMMTRQFMHTQFEIITAPMTLKIALEKYDLLNRLGGDKSEAMKRMEKSTRTTQRHGTDLIEISYRDEDAELARDGTTAVYEAYRDRRTELEMNLRKEQLKAIKVELQNKDDRVAELRKRLMDISEKVGLIWVETEQGGKTVGLGLELRNQAEKELYEASREREKLTIQIKRISVADTESLLASSNDLKEDNDYIQRLHEHYLLRESELDALKSAVLAKEHPKIKLHSERLAKAEQALKKSVIKELETFKHKAALLDGRIKKMKNTVNDMQDQGTQKARAIQEFNVARKEYQTALSIKDQMQIRYDVEKTKLILPTNNIIVHQIPEKGTTRVTRGREFITTLGTVLSLPFSIVCGIILMYIAELIFPRREAA